MEMRAPATSFSVLWVPPDAPDFLSILLSERLQVCQVHPMEEELPLADCWLVVCTQSNGAILSYQMTGEGWRFLSLPVLLSAAPRRSAAEFVDVIDGGFLQTTLSCVFACSSLDGLLNRHSDSGKEAYASHKEAGAAV